MYETKMAAASNLYATFGFMVVSNGTTAVRLVKLSTEIDHTHAYKYYIKHCFRLTMKISHSINIKF
jgi:hypothetical protein